MWYKNNMATVMKNHDIVDDFSIASSADIFDGQLLKSEIQEPCQLFSWYKSQTHFFPPGLSIDVDLPLFEQKNRLLQHVCGYYDLLRSPLMILALFEYLNLEFFYERGAIGIKINICCWQAHEVASSTDRNPLAPWRADESADATRIP